MVKKVHYAVQPDNADKSAKARGNDVRIHFKNTREAASALRGFSIKRAFRYLDNVLKHKEIVPFRRYSGGVGRHALASRWGTPQGRWPERSVRYLQKLLKNAEANATSKSLDLDKCYISHIAVQRAMVLRRRRTYRAHGRINPYTTNPCHIEVILTEKVANVPKSKAPTSGSAAPTRKSARQAKQATA